MYFAPILSNERTTSAETTSLAEILGAFSYALDLTEGQPAGHSLRACWIASRMADLLRLGSADRRTVYYATLLKDLGCSSNAARVAELYETDDRAFKRDFKLVAEGLKPTLHFVLGNTAKGQRLGMRARAIANILRNGQAIATDLIRTRCTRGADIARQLRFSEQVADSIAALDEHWDGSGKPLGQRGSAIPLPAQLALLAQIADVFHAAGGPDAARAEIAARSGTWFDPMLVQTFLTLAKGASLWRELTDPALDRHVRDFEPEEGRLAVDEDYLDEIAAAFGAVIDAKSPYTAGHSDRVGLYAESVGARLGVTGKTLRSLRRAAVLHDVGKLAISSRILEKPGKLDAAEWEQMRSHAAYTTEILSRITPLRAMAAVAGAHHERLDGQGYPLGLDAMMIAREVRIITTCDFYDALTADRPYRDAILPDRALGIMANEVGKAIDPQCFAALKEAVDASTDLRAIA